MPSGKQSNTKEFGNTDTGMGVRLNRVIRVGLIEKVTFEQRFKLLPELFST